MVWKRTLAYSFSGLGRESFFCTFYSRLFERDWSILVEDPRWLFVHIGSFRERFPRHFVFGNFECLRCGGCCEGVRDVSSGDVEGWMFGQKREVLGHVSCWSRDGTCASVSDLSEPCEGCDGGQIMANGWSGRCPFLRKVRNKPYYGCRIHDALTEECSGFLCDKSWPIAHLDWDSIEELIEKFGVEGLRRLWGRKERSRSAKMCQV